MLFTMLYERSQQCEIDPATPMTHHYAPFKNPVNYLLLLTKAKFHYWLVIIYICCDYCFINLINPNTRYIMIKYIFT